VVLSQKHCSVEYSLKIPVTKGHQCKTKKDHDLFYRTRSLWETFERWLNAMEDFVGIWNNPRKVDLFQTVGFLLILWIQSVSVVGPIHNILPHISSSRFTFAIYTLLRSFDNCQICWTLDILYSSSLVLPCRMIESSTQFFTSCKMVSCIETLFDSLRCLLEGIEEGLLVMHLLYWIRGHCLLRQT
jgi:hypothetical protein